MTSLHKVCVTLVIMGLSSTWCNHAMINMIVIKFVEVCTAICCTATMSVDHIGHLRQQRPNISTQLKYLDFRLVKDTQVAMRHPGQLAYSLILLTRLATQCTNCWLLTAYCSLLTIQLIVHMQCTSCSLLTGISPGQVCSVWVDSTWGHTSSPPHTTVTC